MVLKLYGYPTSTCTLRVAVTLKEKNVPFEFIPIDLVGGQHKTPAFTVNQPFGQVPYIVEDDGFQMYESRAIARYIAAKYANVGEQLVPKDLRESAIFEQGASIELTDYEPFVSGLAWENKFTQMYGGTKDEKRADSLLTTWRSKLDAYDKILAQQKYIGGNKITLADLFHLPYGSVLLGIGIDEFSSRPNVARWWNDITSRPSWQGIKDGL